MSDTIERARALLEERIAELEAEITRVRKALAGLDGTAPLNGATRTSSNGRRTPKVTPRRARASRGERERQLTASIEANPAFTVTEHARAIGVRPQQLYPILRRLEGSGAIRKTDKGYRAATPEPARN